MPEPRKYDPNTTDTRENARGKIGWWGPFPSTPCTHCGGEFFAPMGDWGMGYYCTECRMPWKEPSK